MRVATAGRARSGRGPRPPGLLSCDTVSTDPERIVEAERAIRDREADVYDDHRRGDAYLRAVEDACAFHALGLRPTDTVLDAGCGTGLQLGALLEQAGRVIGVDHSPASIERARARTRDVAGGRLELLAADLRELPLETASVDRVISNGVLQHIPTEAFRLQALRELHRVLRPGGVLVVLAYRWLGHIRRARDGYFDSGLYRHAFTARELRSLLGAAGFGEVGVGGVAIAPALAERLGVSAEAQRRLAFTPLGRHAAHYVVGRGVRTG